MNETRFDPVAPLILLCPPRSFSTVVCAMLGQHPELYGFPELNLFVVDTVKELLELDGSYSAGVVRVLEEVQPASAEQAMLWLQVRREWSTRRLFDYLLEQVQPRRGVDKSPRTALARRSLDRALAFYPQTRFLHLTRDPVATLGSMLEAHRAAAGRGEDDASLTNYYAALCCHAHKAILSFTAALAPERTMRVRGEDLLVEPERHLPRIAAWLGLRTDPEVIEAMRHPERWVHARAGPYGDPNFFRDPRLRRPAPKPTAQSEWPLDAFLRASLTDLAGRLGYAPC